MWREKAKALQYALNEFMESISFRYDEEDDEYYIFGKQNIEDRDFLSTLDALRGDLEYYDREVSMNINDLAWLLVDGEHWEDIEDILDMSITDIDKDKLYQYLVEELVHNISEKKLDILIEKYK